MPSWTTQVVAALGQYIADQGVGTWTPDGIYSAGQVGIFDTVMPPEPDRVLVITAYTPVGSTHLSDLTLGLQIRARGGRDPRGVSELDDALYGALHGARGLALGPAVMALVWRQSHLRTGTDANGRFTTSSNFYAQTAHPSQHATD